MKKPKIKRNKNYENELLILKLTHKWLGRAQSSHSKICLTQYE
jgi:hypothetical protein